MRHKIINPETGRYVYKTGSVGKKILETLKSPKSKSPKFKSPIKSPKFKSPIKYPKKTFIKKKSERISPKKINELDVNNIKLNRSPSSKDSKDLDILYSYIHDEDKVTNVKIIVFGNKNPEKKYKKGKCDLDDVAHAVLRFTVPTPIGDEYYDIEWGNISGNITSLGDGKFDYNERSWNGCILSNKTLKKPIKFKIIAEHAVKWKKSIGKGGQYPKNCRGYVDSFLVSVLKEKPLGADQDDWLSEKN